jgi:hypothetical protein
MKKSAKDLHASSFALIQRKRGVLPALFQIVKEITGNFSS